MHINFKETIPMSLPSLSTTAPPEFPGSQAHQFEKLSSEHHSYHFYQCQQVHDD